MFESEARALGTSLPSGPESAIWLAGLDPLATAQARRLEALAVVQRHAAWIASVEASLLASLQDDADRAALDPSDREWLAEEVGAVMRLRADFAKSRMAVGHTLARRLPDTCALLADAVITPYQARLVAEAVLGLDDESCAEIEARVLLRAADQSSTQFRRSLNRAVMAVVPVAADEAQKQAVADRRVEIRAADDGMALLVALLPAPEAMRLKTAIWRRAMQLRGEDGELPLPAYRADALIECGDRYLAESDPTGVLNRADPAVQVIVPLAVLTGDSDEPGELVGYGPIPAGLAREIAADPNGTWQRLVTDARGVLIDLGRNRYRPPKSLADHVRARDRACAFPTCNKRAQRCELDHVTPWSDGGETNAANLAPLCPRHHHLKHETRWTLRCTGGGRYEWTSPTGRKYRKPRPD